MSIRPLIQQDLDWLVCPVCHGPLHLEAAPPTVVCTRCSRIYPVIDGLPVLLAARAPSPKQEE